MSSASAHLVGALDRGEPLLEAGDRRHSASRSRELVDIVEERVADRLADQPVRPGIALDAASGAA